MKIIRQKKDLGKLINKINSFSFIPTMGGLHKGHEILIKKAQKKKKIPWSVFLLILNNSIQKKIFIPTQEI